MIARDFFVLCPFKRNLIATSQNISSTGASIDNSRVEGGLLPPAIRRMTEGYIFSLSTFRGGGSQVPVSDPDGEGGRGEGGGGPRSQILGGGVSQVSNFLGGVPGLRFLGVGPRSQIFGGVPGLRFFRGGSRSQ